MTKKKIKEKKNLKKEKERALLWMYTPERFIGNITGPIFRLAVNVTGFLIVTDQRCRYRLPNLSVKVEARRLADSDTVCLSVCLCLCLSVSLSLVLKGIESGEFILV